VNDGQPGPGPTLLSSPDEALIPRILAGNEQAFAVLVGRYHKRMVRLALSFVHTPASAEEMAQETWLAVIHGIDRFEGRSSFKVWLFRILANRAKSRAEREARSLPFSCFDSAEDDSSIGDMAAQFGPNGRWLSPTQEWEQDTPEKLLLSHETRTALQQGIDRLPPAQRAVLVMRDVEGLDAEEVCTLLAISDANQRVLLHRARTTLRCVLDSHVKKR
jgi:RNA polymerase sigma-70 factor (ECF subfamily)